MAEGAGQMRVGLEGRGWWGGLVGAGLEGGAIRTEESSLAVSAVTVERPKQLRSAPPPNIKASLCGVGGGVGLAPGWFIPAWRSSSEAGAPPALFFHRPPPRRRHL